VPGALDWLKEKALRTGSIKRVKDLIVFWIPRLNRGMTNRERSNDNDD
jgi:hypothetical protein